MANYIGPTGLNYLWGKVKSLVSGKANDADVVHKTGDEQISGQKTFNNRVNFIGTSDANAIYLSTDTRIDVNGTTYTVLGFASGTFLINHANYNLKLRGKGTRPAYNTDSNYIALLSDIPTVPTKVSDLDNDSGFITSYTETDPTVPSWAKAANKPSYTAAEVGALPDTTAIPTESTVSGWGFTKNAGTITGITMNGASKGTSGIVDLGTVITSHQDISGKENTSNKVTSLSASSTDTQYPSAKCVWDLVGDIETILASI